MTEELRHGTHLLLSRCPHCGIAKPALAKQWEHPNSSSGLSMLWVVYECTSCKGLVTVVAPIMMTATRQQSLGPIVQIFPDVPEIDATVPERPRTFLTQAQESLHTPAGAVMLAASAVDSMLKVKGYKDGTLNSRIDKAAVDHLITKEMAQWAHQVRLDANDQRHADADAPLPEKEHAELAVEFAKALAQFLFVLPARVTRGLESSSQKKK